MASFGHVMELVGKVANRFIVISVGFGIGGLFIYKNAAEAFPNQVCKPIVGLKDEDGSLLKVSERIRTQFDVVLNKLGYTNANKISLFINQGVHPMSVGSTSFPNGAVVSLPKWYIFENYKDIETCGITFQGRDIRWDSELGIKIKECLLPSDEMIAFCIAHEVAQTQRLDYKAINAVLAPSWLYLTYKLAYIGPRMLQLHTVLDILFKLVLCRLSYLCYKQVHMKLYHDVVYQADVMAAKCEPRMLQGGIDVFTKKIELNRIRRRLMGRKGQNCFTEEGNDIESRIYPLLTDRLKRLKDLERGTALVTGVRAEFSSWGSNASTLL